MTYHFTPGQRIFAWSPSSNGESQREEGRIVDSLPASGLPDASGIRADRVRVKLDRHPRPLVFNTNDVEPV